MLKARSRHERHEDSSHKDEVRLIDPCGQADLFHFLIETLNRRDALVPDRAEAEIEFSRRRLQISTTEDFTPFHYSLETFT